jgi:hypothetical protein
MWCNKPNEVTAECKKALLLVLEEDEFSAKVDRWGGDLLEADWELLQKNTGVKIIRRSITTTGDSSSRNTSMCRKKLTIA